MGVMMSAGRVQIERLTEASPDLFDALIAESERRLPIRAPARRRVGQRGANRFDRTRRGPVRGLDRWAPDRCLRAQRRSLYAGARRRQSASSVRRADRLPAIGRRPATGRTGAGRGERSVRAAPLEHAKPGGGPALPSGWGSNGASGLPITRLSHGDPLSGSVVVVAYRPHWVEEFARIAGRIRDLVGPAAIRIDHIGSTAVPGLGAKDVIDLQITVGDLDQVAAVASPLRAAGFDRTRRSGTTSPRRQGAPPISSCARSSCESRRGSGGRTSTSESSAGSTSGMRCCFATTFARRRTPRRVRAAEARGRPDLPGQHRRLSADQGPGLPHACTRPRSLWAEKVGWRPGDDYR